MGYTSSEGLSFGPDGRGVSPNDQHPLVIVPTYSGESSNSSIWPGMKTDVVAQISTMLNEFLLFRTLLAIASGEPTSPPM
jgi:hypothetical protein